MNARASKGSLWLVSIAALGAMVVLLALGTWQVVRLQWKTELIAQTEARIAGPPATLGEVETQFEETRDVDYLPVRIEGRFLPGEAHYLNTLDGISGWNVYAPFEQTDGRFIIVNRGFVPDQLKQPSTREALPGGTVVLDGLARNAPAEKPSAILPDNDLAQNQFFWRDLSNMASMLDLKEASPLPFFVDAGEAATPPGGWPRAGTTRVVFSNNHLQYVITWYGLALALAGVYIAFVRKRMREQDDGQ